jgi:sulfite exporter TauE/SafE/copper chaperone CopZ
MSRRHARNASRQQRLTKEVREPGPSFKLEVDGMLLEQAAEQPAAFGRTANAWARPIESISTTVPVAGMTCRSCEIRIQRLVSRLPNVQRVKASAVRGRVEIESSAPVPAEAIARAIHAAGYEVGHTPWLERDLTVWLTAASGIVLVAAIALLAQLTGITGLASGTGSLSGGGLVVALLLGLAAGVSTCMALVGGLVLALSAAFQTKQAASRVGNSSVGAMMRPALAFMAGRVVGYGAFGAALGAIGASVTMPPHITAALMIAVAAVMMILGTRLTGLSPRIASWSPTLPIGVSRRLGIGGATGGYSDGRAAGLGAASFFLPCGFTQAVQIYALSTGSPLFAGALMATFAIGTAPGLLALAGLPAVVPSRMRPTLLRLVGVVVLGFALLNGSAGLRLSGISLSLPGLEPVAAAGPPAQETAADGSQLLTTYQNGGGYSPGNVAIYAGTATRWTIKSSTTATCAASLIVPSLNLRVGLHEGDNVINLPALPKGALEYSCAMGMYGGQITIVDRPAPSPTGTAAGG